MHVKPISRDIYSKAKNIGLKKITLQLSSWRCDVELDVEIDPPRPQITTDDLSDLLEEIGEWALHVYSDYSPDDDIYPYGVDICYDIIEGTVLTSKWFTERKDGDKEEGIWELEED
jgi:hypothetical protein